MKIILSLLLLSLSFTAMSKDTLVVYGHDSFVSEWGPGPKIKEAFEKECQCHLKFVSFGNSVTMFNRLRLEGDKPKADVLVGLDNNLLKTAEDSGLFAKTSLDMSQLRLPVQWKSQTFIPYDYGQYAFIYDANKLKNPPTSLKALIENEKISVIYQDPRTSTVGRGLLAWVNAVYGDKTEQAWKQLAKHTVTVGKGWSESYGAFLKGESDVVLSYNTSPLYHQINEGKNNYKAMSFTEGHIVQIELAAKLKTSQKQALAERFLAFLWQPDIQKIIALHNIMLPVIDTKIDPYFDAFTPVKTLAIPQPDADISKKQVEQWQRAVSQ